MSAEQAVKSDSPPTPEYSGSEGLNDGEGEMLMSKLHLGDQYDVDIGQPSSTSSNYHSEDDEEEYDEDEDEDYHDDAELSRGELVTPASEKTKLRNSQIASCRCSGSLFAFIVCHGVSICTTLLDPALLYTKADSFSSCIHEIGV